MENTFDLKKFLVENKLTTSSRLLSEEEEVLEEGWKNWILGGLLTLSTLAGGTKIYQLDQQAQQDRAKQTEYLQKVVDPILGKMSDQDLSHLGTEIASKTGEVNFSSEKSLEELDTIYARYATNYIQSHPTDFGITSTGQLQYIGK